MAEGANGRVIRVINYLAAHPMEAFTISELAERLSISTGSAHRVLKTLTEAGYLSRHPRQKTYSLGLALVAIGHAALQRHRVVAIAQREIERVSRELKGACIANAITDNEILYVAKEGVSNTHSGVTSVGDRRPFIPPLALCHIAWADRTTIDAYLSRAPASMPEAIKDHLPKALEVIRKRGYSVATIGKGIRALSQIVTDYADHYLSEAYWQQLDSAIGQLSAGEVQLLSLSNPGKESISFISVPVFSAAGDVVLELSLTGLPHDAGTDDIERYADRMLAAAANVTGETYGRRPAQRNYSNS